MNRPKPPVVLVFGEDDNDREAVKQLLYALRPDLPTVAKRARPLVLVKGREAAKARKNALDVARVARAERTRSDVRMVFAHQDCDAVEPAHEAIARDIEAHLSAAGERAIAVVPAWEMEAWWFLWPDAAQAVNPSWARPARTGERVGLIVNAKEALRRALRPKGKRARDYEESDGPRIAEQVRLRGEVRRPDAQNASFERFRERVDAAAL
ncbi:MAG: hypothetical protein AMXMBFR77_28760 [Phycisphaerales bacterium]